MILRCLVLLTSVSRLAAQVPSTVVILRAATSDTAERLAALRFAGDTAVARLVNPHDRITGGFPGREVRLLRRAGVWTVVVPPDTVSKRPERKPAPATTQNAGEPKTSEFTCVWHCGRASTAYANSLGWTSGLGTRLAGIEWGSGEANPTRCWTAALAGLFLRWCHRLNGTGVQEQSQSGRNSLTHKIDSVNVC